MGSTDVLHVEAEQCFFTWSTSPEKIKQQQQQQQQQQQKSRKHRENQKPVKQCVQKNDFFGSNIEVQGNPSVAMATTDSIRLSAAQQTSFALRLASAVSSPSNADGARGNVAFSPLSLHPSFKEVAVGKYRAETHSVDFKTKGKFDLKRYRYEVAAEVAGQVNSWVDQVTSGLIKEILPAGSIEADTRLVLGNALYFKGTWVQKFHASDTKDDNFYILDKTYFFQKHKTIEAPFMSSTKNQYISSFENLKVLKLPYQHGGDKTQFSMYILLPKAQDGLWSLARKLTSEPEFLEKHIPARAVPVGQFRIPKFKISFDFEASKLFKSLGLQLPFSTEADLSEMVDSPLGQSLCISSIFHKSFVEVNEEGTEAAAATFAVAMSRSLSAVPPRKVDFVADHPFLFVIREDMTGVVLFVGHMVNPILAA
ncbi:Serpin-ZX [Triticum urartu]|uniref:Serpin-ZX n=2 Tax=Triticum urartu TaxID=4572 RepID=M7Z7Y3_TRIUA|nr:Serpin-ZX [Triticum urartu]